MWIAATSARQGRLVIERDLPPQRRERHRAVEHARVEIEIAEALRQRLGDGALARPGRAINGDRAGERPAGVVGAVRRGLAVAHPGPVGCVRRAPGRPACVPPAPPRPLLIGAWAVLIARLVPRRLLPRCWSSCPSARRRSLRQWLAPAEGARLVDAPEAGRFFLAARCCCAPVARRTSTAQAQQLARRQRAIGGGGQPGERRAAPAGRAAGAAPGGRVPPSSAAPAACVPRG